MQISYAFPSALSVAGALVFATAGGILFWYMNFPLAWMLGAMIATTLAALLGISITTPAMAIGPTVAIIGCMLGSSVRPEIVAQLSHWLLPVTGLMAYLFAAGASCYGYLRWIARLDKPTAYFAGMPAGFVEMIILGGERGGDEKVIALVHSSRILLVVLCLPILIQLVTGVTIGARTATYQGWSAMDTEMWGWALLSLAGGTVLGKLVRLPAGVLLGPMLVSAALHVTGTTDFVLPTPLLALAQIILGASIGCRFVGTRPKFILKMLLISAGATGILMSLTVLIGMAISAASHVPLEALLLAYSPGGLAEMSLVAFALGLDVPFVVLHHTVRSVLVTSVAVLFYRLVPRNDDD